MATTCAALAEMGTMTLVCCPDMLDFGRDGFAVVLLVFSIHYAFPSTSRYMNTSEVNCVHCMKMTAFLTNLSAVGMALTGKYLRASVLTEEFLPRVEIQWYC